VPYSRCGARDPGFTVKISPGEEGPERAGDNTSVFFWDPHTFPAINRAEKIAPIGKPVMYRDGEGHTVAGKY